MKYYIYSYMWTNPQMSQPSFATDVYSGSNGMVGLYEDLIKQSVDICLTHVAEITEEEYDQARSSGIIG